MLMEQKLKQREQQLLSRKIITITARNAGNVTINQKALVNFSSNDYLGIATHPQVKKAFIHAAEKYGVGSSSSPLLAGYYHPHYLLEEKMAEFLQRDRAILFNSGYMANIGMMTVLVNRHMTVLADKFCHASLLDGIKLSQANYYRFKHNDMEHLNYLLKNNLNSVIVSESIFSMEGKINDLPTLIQIAKQHSSLFILDDAHGIGVLGKNGGGASEHFQLKKNDIACLVTPLGKSFGCMGAIVSGENAMIESLLQFSRSYGYTTLLPPAIAAAALAALNIIQTESWRREKLMTLIAYFASQAKARGLILLSEDRVPVKTIMLNDIAKALQIKNHLFAQGFLVSCIRPPTVPLNTTRLRISITCAHNKNDIDRLLDLLVKML